MHKLLIKAIEVSRGSKRLDGEDIKSDDQEEFTNMDYVIKHRDFSKTTENDLVAVFLKLKGRCPKTWTSAMEDRAKELHRNFNTLKMGNPSMFIDPDLTLVESKSNELDVQRLITAPESWSMGTRERALEFSEILRHFTIFAPFEGRPFVRAWLQALVPCFSRWILLSEDQIVSQTLKNFLGAFGQPGIVVCLPDKGTAILEILQQAARSVEAVGRGTVERYYWKRLAESSCGVDSSWLDLASLSNKPLLNCQLDYLPDDWVLDSNDWVQIFANFVSPEISCRFEKKMIEMFNSNDRWVVHAGPPKTFARCLAKCREYTSEFQLDQHFPRWAKFAERFKNVFQRAPNSPQDFVWNVVDIARCSITVPGAVDVLKVKRVIENKFPVICVKNSYNSKVRVKGSGYRDLKLLIEVEFEDLQLGRVTKLQSKTTFICEVQILCRAWLENKKSTSVSYKILRAQTLRDLFCDAAKYIRGTTRNIPEKEDVTKIIKNGCLNLAKIADFANIDANKLLIKAATEGWCVDGVKMLVKDMKANLEVTDADGWTPLMRVCVTGADDLAKCLIELGSNIEHKNKRNCTALIRAVESGQEVCVQILLSARASVTERDYRGMSALDWALKNFHREGTSKSERIVKLLKGDTVSILKETGKKYSQFDDMKKAAVEGCIAQFLDIHDVPHTYISKLLASRTVVGSLENLLQTLWFGGNIEQRFVSSTPLGIASKYGTALTVSVLLDAGANVNARQAMGYTPLHIALRYGTQQVVKLLLEAKADVNAEMDGGYTPLLKAVRYGYGNIVAELLKFGANINDRVGNNDVYKLVSYNQVDRENVMNILVEHARV